MRRCRKYSFGPFLVLFGIGQINGEDLAQASHETVVDSIRRSGNLVTITVCSAIKPGTTMPSTNEYAVTGNNSNRQYSTLPRKLSGWFKCVFLFF
jgi:hypothetical protein